ncbi:MAG: AraC family transcriptional regulator [Aquabacterium sp.]|nr:MAG: AraC family transcriptional regulator [Aquabacterium sp.]
MNKPDTRLRWAQRLQPAQEWLAAHLDQPLDLHDLAERAHLSPYHFHRIWRGLLGETVADTLRRMRLHRAAVQLLSSRTGIERIARDAQYGSTAAFTRAFREAYGEPPAAYRARTRSQAVADVPLVPQPQAQELTMYQARIENRAPMRVAALPHRGSYHEIGRSFERLAAWAAAHGLMGPHTRSFGLYYDDPRAVPAADLRSEACISLPDGFRLQGAELPGLRELSTPGGPHAIVLHVGPYAELQRAYDWIYGDWLPESGRTPADAPVVEEYLNDCRSLPPTEWRTEVCLALQAVEMTA